MCKKGVLVENEKSEQHHWILNIRIRLATKFQLKLTILTFWTKFANKGNLQSNTEKVDSKIELCIFELAYVPNFSLNWQFSFSGSSLRKKGISGQKQKSEQRHWSLHIWIKLPRKFQLKVIISTFWTKFTQKEDFQSKAEKVNFTIEFCIFKLVYVPNFSLNW